MPYCILSGKLDVEAGHSQLIEAPRFDRKGFTSYQFHSSHAREVWPLPEYGALSIL
jgi:hypothetical protein